MDVFVEFEDPPDSTERQIFNWRRDEFLRMGFAKRTAAVLARRRDVDVRATERMLAEGCTHEVAIEILL